LKSNPQSKNIPVIVYSTTSHKKEIEELYKLGAAKFITKPDNMKVLINAISDILN